MTHKLMLKVKKFQLSITKRFGRRHHWSAVITSFFVLGVKVQHLTSFSIFKRIKLKFGREVNSETLIAYLMSILSSKIKIKGFM